MNPIFTIPYSEYKAIDYLSQLFKKKDGYSIFLPVSRQEKGVDFILIKRIKKSVKTVTFQVKSSRPYVLKKKVSSGDIYVFGSWFNVFQISDECNYYLLVIDSPSAINDKWDSLILLFTNKEMKDFLSSVKTMKQNKPDRQFGFSITSDGKVFLVRGRGKGNKPIDYTKYKFENRQKKVRL